MRITEWLISLEGGAFENNLEAANLHIEYSYVDQRKTEERLWAYYQFFLTISEKKLRFWEWESEYKSPAINCRAFPFEIMSFDRQE